MIRMEQVEGEVRGCWCFHMTAGSPKSESAPDKHRTSETTGLLLFPPRPACSLKSFCRFVIHIDSWEAHSNYPNGHFVRVIGPIGDVETETQVVLTENELATASFNKALLRGSGSFIFQCKNVALREGSTNLVNTH